MTNFINNNINNKELLKKELFIVQRIIKDPGKYLELKEIKNKILNIILKNN